MMDGLKIPVQASGDRKMQNAYCIGWLHDHFVNTVFVFAPSGTIVACNLNAPGSWFSKLCCLYLVKSGQKCVGNSNLLLNRIEVQATSLCQSTE